MQDAISAYFGTKLQLTLVVDGGAGQPARDDTPAPSSAPDDVMEDVGDVSELEDAPPVASGAERILEAFPGAVEE